MLLEITTTHEPAEDLGYLLHKHPGRVQTFPLAFGRAHVYYPECTASRCTAALLVDVDPISLMRGDRNARTLDQYVNDRPYVASSMLSVAIAQVFGTALGGTCKTRPEIAARDIPLIARLSVVPCGGGESLIRRLFEPLGYRVAATPIPLDSTFPQWGESGLFAVSLESTTRLSTLLTHLYVLVPVLDNEKHYWVGDDEVRKLLDHGEGWLASHPERDLIATRYLKYRRSLANEAIRRLREQDGESSEALDAETAEDASEARVERVRNLHEERHATIVSLLEANEATSVVDLGCGEGRLLRELLKRRQFSRIVGLDVSHRALAIAEDRLGLDRLPPTARARIELLHGSLLYRDRRIEDLDAAVLCEVIEHLDAERLATMERVVFEFSRPRLVLVSTPNREYNVMWESLSAGEFRHADHRFEWTREEFRAWADRICRTHAYTCEFTHIGLPAVSPEGHDVGAPTQLGVFRRDQ
ncbi:MAG: 3' terminal RNA ribose 2'-O-methyltransferase Hen1 [Phycisphaerae bacterium]|nr:3' terminal RNA ribose 2'-O-methyltransferase Hen1 [Phycisphaerae bacterium]